ncbi:MAG: diaminopimelate decarboxylase [Anaerolineae bacterium]|nr:diaminopimelate decarboxylase [Anaerolineae bacterium]
MHILPDMAARNAQGHLTIGGCDAVELAREHGTPLYVYDKVTLQNAARAYQVGLQKHYPGSSTVAYASKAYLCTALARLWANLGLGLDVVGPGELETALRAGVPPERIHLHGNNKPPELIKRAVEVGVGRIVIDGWHDFERIETFRPSSPVKVWLRLSPGIDVHTHDYRKTGLIDSKFGFPITCGGAIGDGTGDAERAVRRALESTAVELVGLHAHIGSQIFDVEPFAACVETLVDFAAQMHDHFGWQPDEMSPGGGWGVAYTPEQPASPVEGYISAVCEAVVAACQQHSLPLPHLIVEPGRSLVARAGIALYTVGGKKSVPGVRSYVFLDGGLSDNLRPAMYGAQYTALCVNRESEACERVTLCGPFCESGDVLARDLFLPALAVGDVVAVPVSGAYHLSMASTYNGFGRPAAVMVEDGKSWLIQRREMVADLMARDV